MGVLVRSSANEIDQAQVGRLARSKLLPEHLADDLASVEYMMRIGQALGLPPVSSFQHIFVFPDKNGRLKAGMSAHLMQALATAAGHTVHVQGDTLSATATLIRKTSAEQLRQYQFMRQEERQQKLALIEDTERLYLMQRGQIRDQIDDLKTLVTLGGGEDLEARIKELAKRLAQLGASYDLDDLRKEVADTKFDLSRLTRFEVVWSFARAKNAGITEKDVWTNFRPEMLKSRAKSGVVRDGAIEVILGIQNLMEGLGLAFDQDAVEDEYAVSNAVYTPEELGADVDGEGAPLKGRVVDVTREGVSKKQDEAVEIGRKVLGRFPDNDRLCRWLAAQAEQVGKVGQDVLIARFSAVALAVDESDRAKQEVTPEGVDLSSHLQNVITSLRGNQHTTTTETTTKEDSQ